jgi:hypothetical protein
MGAEGFRHTVRTNGDVLIDHHGRPAATLRGTAAAAFLADVESGDPHEIMARVTGDYRRGKERVATRHPRNRGRR